MSKKKKDNRDLLVDYIGTEEISGESAIIASGIVLMQAAEICKAMSDTDGLIRIANAWFDIGKTLLNYVEEEEIKNKPFGFGVMEEIGGIDQGESGIEVRKKSRKL